MQSAQLHFALLCPAFSPLQISNSVLQHTDEGPENFKIMENITDNKADVSPLDEHSITGQCWIILTL
jgi:hypothetical protein